MSYLTGPVGESLSALAAATLAEILNIKKYGFEDMPLDTDVRGAIETLIDQAVRATPKMMHEFHGELIAPKLRLNNSSDFMMGWMWGHVITGTNSYLITTRGRTFQGNEYKETIEVVLRRLDEMRTAVSTASEEK